MITIYAYDANRIFTGAVEVDPMGPVPAGLLTAPPKMTGTKVAQAVGDDWVVLPAYPGPDLAALKAKKNAEINEARLAANFSTFTHTGKAIACDQLSRSDIDGTNGYVSLYGELPAGWPGGWKAVDNTYVPITTVDEWKAFYASMFAAGSANFAKAQALKAQIADATTAEQVAAITW